MSQELLDQLYRSSNRRVEDVSLDLKRYLYDEIDWRDRLICIKGPKGVGKSTLMLQRIKEAFGSDERALYVSLDSVLLQGVELLDLVEEFVISGGAHLFLDEVHHFEGWQLIIKNLYDEYKRLNIVYSGSSLLRIEKGKGDLSRRQIEYNIYGLSFREYLEFEGIAKIPAISLEELIDNHVKVAGKICEGINIIPVFNEYLRNGYYPFYKETYKGFEDRLNQVISQIIENDAAYIESVSLSTVKKLKKMLAILSESCPQTPNMSALYRELDTDRNLGIKMLDILDRGQLIALLSSKSRKLKNMSRPDKIYCDNTNIMHALVFNTDVGCERETFFFNQLKAAGYDVTYPEKGDFMVDGKYLFEIGGRKKSFEQIADEKDSFLAVGDLDVGRKNRIPLWMFGMMY